MLNIMDVVSFFEETSSNGKVFIYGGGYQSRIIVDLLKSFEIEFDGILVSKKEDFDKTKISEEIPVFVLGELQEVSLQDAVIIAVHQKWNEEITKLLEQKGFLRIYRSEDWNKSNAALRRRYLEAYCRNHGVKMRDGKISFQRDGIDFHIADIMEPSYQSMLAGDWNDDVAASIWEDFRSLTEGPYEFENVRLEKGNTVIDLGANIGLFACVAAAKGCEVHAFEPTEKVFAHLQENARINPGIHAYQMAVGNSNERLSFYMNAMDSDDTDTGQNTLFGERTEKWKHGSIKVEVDGITLDSFVEQYHIKKIDFIKADIEGAERYMLMGAQKILRDFSPKLSLCTYHLPDDPIVMERLILKANPNYKILHKWMKLYAYV